MTSAAVGWQTVPRYPVSPQSAAVLPASVQARAESVERRLRKLTAHAPISTPRLYALMCLADRDAAARGDATLSGLEWGYSAWSPVPVGPAAPLTPGPVSVRERLRARRILRAVRATYADLPIDELVHEACRALDELRHGRHRALA